MADAPQADVAAAEQLPPQQEQQQQRETDLGGEARARHPLPSTSAAPEHGSEAVLSPGDVGGPVQTYDPLPVEGASRDSPSTRERDRYGRRSYPKPWQEPGKGHDVVRRRQQAARDAAAAAFDAKLATLCEAIADPGGANAYVEHVLSASDALRAQKRAALYEEWDAEVFGPMQAQVERYVDSIDVAALEHGLLERSNAYCATVRSRGVYREVVDPATYDPWAHRTGALRISTGSLRDPVHRDLDKDAYERQLLRTAGCASAALSAAAPSSPVRLGPEGWLGATHAESVHGRHYNTRGEVELRTAHRTLATRRDHTLRSTVDMDHYRPPGASASPPPARRPVQPPSSRNLAGASVSRILQSGGGAAAAAAAAAGPAEGEGDLWLEMRGRARPPGVGLAAARPRHMFETLGGQHARPDGAPRGAAGDTWLEARGKQMTEAPASGHPRELFEVLSHGGRQSGIPVRDAWITTRGRRSFPHHVTAGLLYLEPTGGGDGSVPARAVATRRSVEPA